MANKLPLNKECDVKKKKKREARTGLYYDLCLTLESVFVFSLQVITNLVKMLKARDIRRPFCPRGHWLSDEVNIRADKVRRVNS